MFGTRGTQDPFPEPFPEPYFEDHRAETAFIHESSYVDTPCHIGEHTSVMHFSHIMSNSIIGSHCFIGRNVTIASGVVLGDSVRVMNNAQLNSGVIMESEVYCGAGTIFAENRHVRAETKNISRISPTLVRRGTQIGPNTTVASGFTIGRFAFIEAGTVVDRNIPDFAVVYGNPLRFAGWRCECGHTILSVSRATPATAVPKPSPRHASDDKISCSYCGRHYFRQSEWKMLQLTAQGDATFDHTSHSDSESDPPIRATQNPD